MHWRWRFDAFPSATKCIYSYCIGCATYQQPSSFRVVPHSADIAVKTCCSLPVSAIRPASQFIGQFGVVDQWIFLSVSDCLEAQNRQHCALAFWLVSGKHRPAGGYGILASESSLPLICLKPSMALFQLPVLVIAVR